MKQSKVLAVLEERGYRPSGRRSNITGRDSMYDEHVHKDDDTKIVWVGSWYLELEGRGYMYPYKDDRASRRDLESYLNGEPTEL